NQTAADFRTLLDEAEVRVLADVRRFPSSRRHPQYDRAALERSLGEGGIRYVWLGGSLGGRRKALVPAEQSANRAWQVEAFRHYADAMGTQEFRAGVATLEALAADAPTVFVCAEKLWWQCHRRLLADLLIVRGWDVVHLLEPGRRDRHRLCEWARVEGGVLTYPALL
ncbi:MAG: DUF488 family protein, partial [Candidatus Binatia bacterium]